MELKVKKWGNSLGIRLPSIYLKKLNIKENEDVLIEVEESCIVIKPLNKKNLKNLFKEYKGYNVSKDFKWDTEAEGKEIW